MAEGALLQVRAAEQISAWLVWDNQAGRGVVHPGRRRYRPADRGAAESVVVDVSALLPVLASGCASASWAVVPDGPPVQTPGPAGGRVAALWAQAGQRACPLR